MGHCKIFGVAMAAAACVSIGGSSGKAAEPLTKSWTAPGHKIHAQVTPEETMAAHPELLSVKFHGLPPAMGKTHAMSAGSKIGRIGKVGALGAVFAHKEGDDRKALEARAIAIRDALARHIPTRSALFETHT